MLVATDLTGLAAASAIAWPARRLLDELPSTGPVGLGEVLMMTPVLWFIWLASLTVLGAYRSRNLGAGAEEFRVVTRAMVIAGLSTSTLCYLGGVDLPRRYLVAACLLGGALLVVERYTIRKVMHQRFLRGNVSHRVLLVGAQESVFELGRDLLRARHLGYQVVGCTVTDPGRAFPHPMPAEPIGWAHDIRRAADDVGADTVMVAGGHDLDLREIAWNLEGADVDMIVVPRLADVSGPRMHMKPVAGLPLLHVDEPSAGRAAMWPKRAFDLVASLVGIALISPILLVVAVLIKLDDGGPILFRQHRVGLNGEIFGCLKFRSMRVDAPALEAKMREESGHEGALFKMQGDPRITKIGAFIRDYSIDELPQLFNVVGGSMSLVGPRPQQQWEVDTYTERARRRLHVRPGMTGLWQVSGRSNLTWEDAIRLDLYYRDNWSMLTDFVIILKTIKAVVGKDGAY